LPRKKQNRHIATARSRSGGSLGPAPIIAAALVIARKVGFGGLSMRLLAAKLDVTATALYYHFPNKNALLDGVGGHIMESIAMPDRRLPWNKRLRELILLQQQTLMKYPGLARFCLNHRESAGAMRWMEMILEVLHDGGFRGVLATRALLTLSFFVNPLALLDDRPHPGRNLMIRRKSIESRITSSPQRYPRLAELLPTLADYPYEAHLPIALERIIAGLGDERARFNQAVAVRRPDHS
jgi:AcrR family transcriptional regulator